MNLRYGPRGKSSLTTRGGGVGGNGSGVRGPHSRRRGTDADACVLPAQELATKPGPRPSVALANAYPGSRASAIVWSIVSACCCSWRTTNSPMSPSPSPRSAITSSERWRTARRKSNTSGNAQEGKLAPFGSGGRERVIDVHRLVVEQASPAVPLHGPKILERRDVAEIPDERPRQRRVDPLEISDRDPLTSARVRSRVSLSAGSWGTDPQLCLQTSVPCTTHVPTYTRWGERATSGSSGAGAASDSAYRWSSSMNHRSNVNPVAA
jgi:hypothetical protein